MSITTPEVAQKMKGSYLDQKRSSNQEITLGKSHKGKIQLHTVNNSYQKIHLKKKMKWSIFQLGQDHIRLQKHKLQKEI